MSTVDIFFSNHLSESIDASSATIPTSSTVLGDVSATVLVVDVSATTLQNTFYYKTDVDIATAGTDDVLYYVDVSQWSTMANDLDAENGSISIANGAYVANDTLSEDFLRNLAYQLFGTHLGVDLFNNETTVKANLNTSTASLASSIQSTISDVGISGTDASLNGTAGSKYFDDSVTGTKNVTREIINQLLDNSTSRQRFVDISSNWTYDSTPGQYKVPLIAGDSISYAVTVNPHADQDTNVATGGSTSSRKYRVKFVLQ